MRFLLMLLCPSFSIAQQNVGIGTTTPEARLHVRSTGWIKTIFENDAGQPRGYIGTDNNGTVTLAANAFWNGSAWVYPNTGASFYMLMHRVNNQFEFRVRPDGGSQNTAMVINQHGNVGIGTTSPQNMLSVSGEMNVDQGNTGIGNTPTLSFGNTGNEGIGSKRDAGIGQNGLDFYTNGIKRMTILNNGNIGINNLNPKSRLTIYHAGGLQVPFDIDDGHAITIFDSSYFSYGEPRVSLNIGMSSLWEYGYIRVRKNTSLGPVPRLLLNPLAEGAVVVGGGGDGSGYAREADDYKFIVGRQSPALFDNKVDVTGNLTVNNGKGIIRNTTSTQLKQVITSVSVNGPFIGGLATHTQNVTWSEAFGASPVAVYVGNATSGGGWAEVVVSIANVSATGCILYVFNPRNFTVNPTFNINLVATGAQ